MTRRAKGGTTKTKHKQLAQLAGRQNIKLELKMGNYANWFITLATGNVEGENNNKGGKQKNKFKMPNCTNFNRHEKRVTNCTRIALKYSRAQGVASSSQSQYSMVGRRQLSGKRRFQIS